MQEKNQIILNFAFWGFLVYSIVMHSKKFCKRVITISVLTVVCISLIIFSHWNRNYNKYSLLKKYNVDNNKELYLLGTIDKKHFNKINNYSINDMISVIENVEPDMVMIQAREDHHRKFGIIDGKIDACVAYSYCFENKIPSKFIDWWLIDNIYPKKASTNLRDDNMFIKISRNMKTVPENSKILVICNVNNFYEQAERFLISGLKEEKISDKKSYYKGKKIKFKFPSLVNKIWKDRTYFYAYSFPNTLIATIDLKDAIKNKYITSDHDKFYDDEMKYCKKLNDSILAN